MQMTVMLILAMILLVALGNWDVTLRRSYRCPQCGTQREGDHSESCSFRGKDD